MKTQILSYMHLGPDDMTKSRYFSGKPVYITKLPYCALAEIDQPIPLVVDGRGCIGVAVPFELHITREGTTVFFTVTDLPGKVKEDLFAYVRHCEGDAGMRADSDTGNSGMTAAMRMSMGINRSPRDIGRGRPMVEADDPDEEGHSLWDMMRMSNPNMADLDS